MRSLGIDDDDEIRRFADPQYWISYFPPHVKRDLEMMGLKVNLRHFSYSKQNIFIGLG
jgi:leucyl-tRNA synthetase